jgi:hypothetical protein
MSDFSAGRIISYGDEHGIIRQWSHNDLLKSMVNHQQKSSIRECGENHQILPCSEVALECHLYVACIECTVKCQASMYATLQAKKIGPQLTGSMCCWSRGIEKFS